MLRPDAARVVPSVRPRVVRFSLPRAVPLALRVLRLALPRAVPLAALLCVPLMAGCLEGDRASLAGWTLDCSLARFERDRAPWAQDCLARASHTVGPKQEIWLAVNPTNPDNVVLGAKDNNPESSAGCTWNGVFVTHDGGKSWTDVVIGGRYIDRKPGELWYGYACNTDPMFRFSADGTLHYAVELYNLGDSDSHGQLGPSPATGRPYVILGWRLVLATSYDGGLTWPDAISVLEGDGIVALNDYSRMTISPTTGTILTAIGFLSGTDFLVPGLNLPPPFGATVQQNTTHSFCWVTASRDKGKSAAEPAPVPAGDPPAANMQGAPKGYACQVIAAAPDGTIVVGGQPGGTALGGKEASGRISFATSRDDGRTFSQYGGGFSFTSLPGYFDNTRFRASTNFELAYDLTEGLRRGTLYTMYSDAASGNADIYVRRSPDNGATWSDAVMVNQDGADGGTHDQWLPNFAVAGDGSLHAFYFDRRWDPDNRLIDVTHAVSTDGGDSWREERVTTVPFDGDLGVHQEGFPFIGDYNGVDAVGNHVWGGFPDASNGATTVVAAAHVHK